MAKKTIKVEHIKAWANKELERTDEYARTTPGFKAGICLMLERILHDTGNYQGFMYLYWMEGGCEDWYAAGEPNFPKKDEFLYGLHDSKYRGCVYARVYY